jgi:hypothetical protein
MERALTLPLVTVIIPARHEAGRIDAALQSILRQSLRDREVFVIDDASADATGERANSLQCFARSCLMSGSGSAATALTLVGSRGAPAGMRHSLLRPARVRPTGRALPLPPGIITCAGDADPLPRALREMKLLRNPQRPERHRAHAATFTWRRTAEAYLSAYREASG